MKALYVDTEQADLIDAAVEMAHAALLARSKRADPDRIISDSHKLMANKLHSVRAQLAAPDAPEWPDLAEPFRAKALNLMRTILAEPKSANATAAWKSLRALTEGPDVLPSRA